MIGRAASTSPTWGASGQQWWEECAPPPRIQHEAVPAGQVPLREAPRGVDDAEPQAQLPAEGDAEHRGRPEDAAPHPGEERLPHAACAEGGFGGAGWAALGTGRGHRRGGGGCGLERSGGVITSGGKQ